MRNRIDLLPAYRKQTVILVSARQSRNAGVLAGRRRGVNRSGSLIIEAVIAVALLATASYALMRLAKSAAVLSQQADQQLVASLTADNAIERLRGLNIDQAAERATAVADAVSDASGCEVEISSLPFTTPRHAGLHIRAIVTVGSKVRVTAHDWRVTRLERPDESKPEAQGEDADE